MLKRVRKAGILSQPFSKFDSNILSKQKKEQTMVTGGARERRGKWRRAKAPRKLQKAARDSGKKVTGTDDAAHRTQPDRLLLSALKYWEVERDLIEERLASMRSAAAAS
jgi:hypothetical protein